MMVGKKMPTCYGEALTAWLRLHFAVMRHRPKTAIYARIVAKRNKAQSDLIGWASR